MRLGMVGLGRMGGNMAERLRRDGHEVVGYDRAPDGRDVDSLAALVEALGPEGRRVAWVMVPAGDATEATIQELGDLMGPGDVIVDGGNSNFKDSIRRAGQLAEKGIGWVDAGTSGGVWGLQNGYALMVGGLDEHVQVLWPALETLSPGEGNGLTHVGPPGAGHFTKMVHNGVEYGMMQAFAEGYAILEASELGIDVLAGLRSWQTGSVVRSWLLDLMVKGLEENPGFEGIAPTAKDSGEGRWTVEEAVRLGVAAPVIAASLFARFVSQDETDVEMRAISALRNQFGGHAVTKLDEQEPAEPIEPARPSDAPGASPTPHPPGDR
ncbi:decarboxylating 6-phosphogluconate dehydrogenase [Iamia sp. SCSIO 61187]|uniref:phosphogluconate dehydrogenase (NAD(+)-dependent, decarboxylating) n=1 Tax=Iamia sp. SCSIO 61187 TaxID=2722752 RepID=UPI001C62B126|nr:decarboxylating 6-phosphogluconate dehydrogenase [Iamia sp. SCSIO 61187]QYG94829.1 decarboxylating 6-phosphogluconate dehydrogenase [Iamia sp. SCSIO 61187]